MSTALASSVSSDLERQIRKVLSVVLVLSIFELVANALAQAQLLNILAFLMLAILMLISFATLFSSWLRAGDNFWFLLHGLAVALALVLWPFMAEGFEAGVQSKPWIWWTLGIGVLSFGIFTRWWTGGAFLLFISIGWFLVFTSNKGGAATFDVALQDAVYLFLFGGSIIGMLHLVRRGAKSADQENSRAISSAIEQARIDAVERERQRLDALIHDRVLSTLILAANAKTPEEQQSSKLLASQAITSLSEAAQEPRATPSVTPLGLFRALRKAALQLVPTINISTSGGGSEPIPAIEAQAITEATLQAIDNAARHSDAKNFELAMSSPDNGELEIRVLDDGIGFRKDRIPRDRIGIRTSVLARMKAIGGTAEIHSQPNKGTEIVLRWKS